MSGVSGGGSAGWQTAFDINFANEPSQTIAPDGNYTIGGAAWTKINSAYETANMVITSGTGLVIKPNSTSNFALVRTAPAIVAAFTSAIPNFWLGTRVRAWMYIASHNCAANFDAVCMLFERGTVATGWWYALNGIVYSSAPTASTARTACSVEGYSTGFTTDLHNVFMIDMFQGNAYRRAAYYSGTWNAGWPAMSTLHSIGLAYSRERWSNQIEADVASLSGLLLGAQRGFSPTNLTAVVGATKLEYKL